VKQWQYSGWGYGGEGVEGQREDLGEWPRFTRSIQRTRMERSDSFAAWGKTTLQCTKIYCVIASPGRETNLVDADGVDLWPPLTKVHRSTMVASEAYRGSTRVFRTTPFVWGSTRRRWQRSGSVPLVLGWERRQHHRRGGGRGELEKMSDRRVGEERMNDGKIKVDSRIKIKNITY
jgi:hypothetical protein